MGASLSVRIARFSTGFSGPMRQNVPKNFHANVTRCIAAAMQDFAMTAVYVGGHVSYTLVRKQVELLWIRELDVRGLLRVWVRVPWLRRFWELRRARITMPAVEFAGIIPSRHCVLVASITQSDLLKTTSSAG